MQTLGPEFDPQHPYMSQAQQNTPVAQYRAKV